MTPPPPPIHCPHGSGLRTDGSRRCDLLAAATGCGNRIARAVCLACSGEGGPAGERPTVQRHRKICLAIRITEDARDIWPRGAITPEDALRALRDDFRYSTHQLQELLLTAVNADRALEAGRDPVPEPRALAWARALGIDT